MAIVITIDLTAKITKNYSKKGKKPYRIGKNKYRFL